MTQENPKKMPVRNLERVQEKKFKTYEAAKAAQGITPAGLAPADKVKIFARNDNTFDVVWYKKIEKVLTKAQVNESYAAAKVADSVVAVKKVPFKKGKKQYA